MSAVPVTDHYQSQLATHSLPGEGIAWLDALRRTAFEQFSSLGFPTTRNEEWKYTRVSAIENTLFRTIPEICLGMDEDDIQAHLFGGMDTWRLVFVNGQFMPMLSTRRSELPDNMTVASLARTLQENPDVVQPHLGQYADSSANGFAALNAAFMADGAYIHIPRNVQADKPIHLLFLSTVSDDDVFSQPRNLIVVEQGAGATVIESYAGLGDSGYLTNVVTEVVLAGNAELRHFKLQDESDKAYHIATLQVEQARDSRFLSHSVAFGALLSRNDINSVLNDTGAHCGLDGLYFLDGRQHSDFHTRVDHKKPHCTSDEFYKGVLDGRSRGVFNGKVYVHPDAQQTDAAQSNANLLLSRHAEVDTKPQLEIYADDVNCSHGATVGQLDDDAVFYLQSRGIDPQSARSLLTYAFAGEVIDRADLEDYRETLRRRLVELLPDGQRVRELL